MVTTIRCGRCGDQIVQGTIPGSPQTWANVRGAAVCEVTGRGGELHHLAHYPADSSPAVEDIAREEADAMSAKCRRLEERDSDTE